jgi:hypothetical protein
MLPTRDFLSHDDQPSKAFGAAAFVLFTTRPVAVASNRRYEATCQAYMATLEPDASYAMSYPYKLNPSGLMPTYWFLTSMPAHQTCNQLVARYDYARAKPLISLIGKTGAAGPILVAWDKTPDSAPAPRYQIVLDLSNFSDDDIQRAFQIWIQQFARDPSLWQHGFDIVRLKEGFRNLIKTYGEQIMKVIDKSA